MATKKDFIANITKKLNYLSKEDAEIAVDSVIELIKNELCKRNRIEIRGFGAMSIRDKKSSTKDYFYKTVYFRMSKNVQDALKDN